MGGGGQSPFGKLFNVLIDGCVSVLPGYNIAEPPHECNSSVTEGIRL